MKQAIVSLALLASLGIATAEDCVDTVGQFEMTKHLSGATITKGCNWVGNQPKFRCNFINATENCPVTCGTCTSTPAPTPSAPTTPSPTSCVDTVGQFVMINHVTGSSVLKSCNWVGNKTGFRCLFTNAAAGCPVTCSKCTTAPTKAPTTSPTTSPTDGPTTSPTPCADNVGQFELINNNGVTVTKGCYWVSQRPSDRCDYTNVAEKCPVTCDTCS